MYLGSHFRVSEQRARAVKWPVGGTLGAVLPTVKKENISIPFQIAPVAFEITMDWKKFI